MSLTERPCIRLAEHADIPSAAALLAKLFALESQFAPDIEKQKLGLKMIMDNPGAGRVYVAESGGALIGIINLQFSVSTYLGAVTVHIDDLFVDAAGRGRGVGKALLDAAERTAREIGAARITVNIDNVNTPAFDFYRRLGFADMNMSRWQKPV